MKAYDKFFGIAIILASVIFVSACTEISSAKGNTTEYKIEVSGGNDNAIVVEHCGYRTAFNKGYKIPNWVAYEVTKTELENEVCSRTDNFIPDPKISRVSVNTKDYSKSGYDRGHMAPAADMKWSVVAMEESFYLSNVCPQAPELNRGRWLKLENTVRTITFHNDVVYVVCGPIVAKDHMTIGTNKVAVPDAFFKVIYWVDNGEWVAIGFIMENRKCNGNLKTYATSVDNVEKITGMDFFSNLPNEIEDYIESDANMNKTIKLINSYERMTK